MSLVAMICLEDYRIMDADKKEYAKDILLLVGCGAVIWFLKFFKLM
jgi:hypothetical protein